MIYFLYTHPLLTNSLMPAGALLLHANNSGNPLLWTPIGQPKLPTIGLLFILEGLLQPFNSGIVDITLNDQEEFSGCFSLIKSFNFGDIEASPLLESFKNYPFHLCMAAFSFPVRGSTTIKTAHLLSFPFDYI